MKEGTVARAQRLDAVVRPMQNLKQAMYTYEPGWQILCRDTVMDVAKGDVILSCYYFREG
jgi:hypothetical protein